MVNKIIKIEIFISLPIFLFLIYNEILIVHAQDRMEQSNDYTISIIKQPNQLPIELNDFPNNFIEFSLMNYYQALNNLDTNVLKDYLFLYEDGTRVNIEKIEKIYKPINLTIFFDIYPEESSIQIEEFVDILGIIKETKLHHLIICSNRLQDTCIPIENKNENEWIIQINKIFQEFIGTSNELSEIPLDEYISKSITLTNKQSGNNLFVYVKNRKCDDITSIPEGLISTDQKIVYINLSESEDNINFINLLRTLIRNTDNNYLQSGGPDSWHDEKYGLKFVIDQNTQVYRINYKSQLFHDEKIHTIQLAYKPDGAEAWTKEEFVFQPIDENNKNILKPNVDQVTRILAFILPLVLLGLLIVIHQDDV